MLSVGLDLSSNKISIVEIVKNRRGVFIRNAVLEDIPDNSIVKGEIQDAVVLSKSLKEIWRKYRVSGRKVYVGFSNQKAIVKEIKLPLTDEKDIASSIKYQISDFIPIPKNNIFYDYYIMEKGDDYSTIMLVGAVKSMITDVIESLKNAGLITQAIDLNCFALYRVINHIYNLEKIKEEKKRKSFCAVNFGQEMSIIEIITGNTLKHPRSVSVSIKTFVDNLTRKINKDSSACEEIVKKFDFNSILNKKIKEGKKKTANKNGDSAKKIKPEEKNIKIDDNDEENQIIAVMKNTADQLINEIKISIGHFMQENLKIKVDKILLSGEGITNIGKYIEKEINYRVELLNIAENFSLDYIKKKPLFKNKDLNQVANRLCIGIGMAIRGLQK